MSPIGSIVIFAGPELPDGWLWCNGQEHNKDTYPVLYEAIADLYGATVAADRFKVPNLVNKVVMGSGPGGPDLGQTGGAKTSRVEGRTELQHGETFFGSEQANVEVGHGYSHTVAHSHQFTGDVNVLQPYLALNYIIRAI